MTGTELSAALAEKLKVLLPDCAVRPAFTGTLQRLPQRAAVTVGVMQEENADGVFETVLGVQLYARERDDHARLFDAVCRFSSEKCRSSTSLISTPPFFCYYNASKKRNQEILNINWGG